MGVQGLIYFKTNGFHSQTCILSCFNQRDSQEPRHVCPAGLIRFTCKGQGAWQTPVTKSSLPSDWQQKTGFGKGLLYYSGVSCCHSTFHLRVLLTLPIYLDLNFYSFCCLVLGTFMASWLLLGTARREMAKMKGCNLESSLLHPYISFLL